MSHTYDNSKNLLDNTLEITADTISDSSERRQFKRRAARWPAIFTTLDKRIIHGKTQDVSERGASISSPQNLQPGTVVVLQIQSFYDGIKRPLKIVAEVKRGSMNSDSFTLGVYFKDLSKGSLTFLKQYSENTI